MAGAGSRAGTVVVTGARGFLGGAVLSAFLAEGRACEGWVRDGPVADGASLRAVGDLADATGDRLASALAGASAVVHLAGRAHVRSSAGAEALFERDNVAATVRVAQAARAAGVPRFVHVSSVKVNGEGTRPGRPFHVGDAAAPVDAYARSKWRAEQELLRVLADGPTRPTVLRIPMTYGPGARANFAALVRAVQHGWPLPVGALRNRRHLLSVPNLIGALRAALDSPSPIVGTYFVADADAVSTPQLVRAVAAALGRPARLVDVPPVWLRLGGRLVGRSAAVERLAGSLEVDTRPFEAASGWRPAPFGLDAQAVSTLASESRGAAAT